MDIASTLVKEERSCASKHPLAIVGKLTEPYVMLGIEPRLAVCKSSALTTVLSPGLGILFCEGRQCIRKIWIRFRTDFTFLTRAMSS